MTKATLAAAAAAAAPVIVTKTDPNTHAFVVVGPRFIDISANTTIVVGAAVHTFAEDTPIVVGDLIAGTDYQIRISSDGTLVAAAYDASVATSDEIIGGFHYALGGNALARSGGDTVPAINPHSCWDVGFRPASADPRGMVLVTRNAHGDPIQPFWVDIYLLNTEHLANGTSRAGAKIADGWSPPVKIDGSGALYGGLNWHQAKDIYAHHGKSLLSDDEFRAAAFGTTEAKARRRDPGMTGFDDPAIDAPFTSRWGLFQATGCMWTWGHDGDPDEPRAALLGGYWSSAADSGSRASAWSGLPSDSGGSVGARGRCDHVTLG